MIGDPKPLNSDEALLALRLLAERLDSINARLTRLEALLEKILIGLGVSPHG